MNFKLTKAKIIISLIPLAIYLLMVLLIFSVTKIHFLEPFIALTAIAYSFCAFLARPILNIFGNIFTDNNAWWWGLNQAGIFATWIVSGIIIYFTISIFIFFYGKGKIWLFGGLAGLYLCFIYKSMYMQYSPMILIGAGAIIGYAIDSIKNKK